MPKAGLLHVSEIRVFKLTSASLLSQPSRTPPPSLPTPPKMQNNFAISEKTVRETFLSSFRATYLRPRLVTCVCLLVEFTWSVNDSTCLVYLDPCPRNQLNLFRLNNRPGLSQKVTNLWPYVKPWPYALFRVMAVQNSRGWGKKHALLRKEENIFDPNTKFVTNLLNPNTHFCRFVENVVIFGYLGFLTKKKAFRNSFWCLLKQRECEN